MKKKRLGSNIMAHVINEIKASKINDSCPEQDYENCDSCGNRDCNPENFDVN